LLPIALKKTSLRRKLVDRTPLVQTTHAVAIYMNRKHFLPMLVLSPCLCAAASAFAQSVVVYKQVDESGRVTYSNQPMKGAMVVELSPLTVLPKSQAGAVVAATPAKVSAAIIPATSGTSTLTTADVSNMASVEANLRRVPEQNEKAAERLAVEGEREARPVSSAAPASASQPSPATVGVVTTRPPQRENMNAVTARPPINASLSATMLAQQRRQDVRRRIVEGEIEAETQLMVEAQADLQREQAKSVAMRSLRASLLADERANAGKKPLSDDVVATKNVVERHFERVRELQDQVAMHEENLAELKNLLPSPPQRTVLKTAQLKPTATTARLDAPKLR
jgi:hypothetical protein